MSIKEFNTAKPKVAWTLIVKASDASEAALLSNALASINGYVDDIFIQLNAPKGKKINAQVRAIAEQYTDKDKIFEYEWTGNFVKARNDIFSKIPKEYDWIGWMDADDTIDQPENIQPVCAIMPKDVNGIYILYDYDTDEFGNVLISHWASRVVRNNGSFAWKSSIDDEEYSVHETLIAKLNTRSVSNNEFKVVHHAKRDKREDSLIRNIELLEKMYARQQETGKFDPRILFYLATHYYDAFNFKAAQDLLVEYLKVSGWAEERSEAHYYMGKIVAMQKGRESLAKTAFLQAIGENPDNVDAYRELATLDFKAQRFGQAAKWLEKGLAIKRDITPIVRHDNQYELLTLAAQCYVNIGGDKLNDALKSANKALKLRPYDEGAKENRDQIVKLMDYRDNIKATTRLIRKLEKDEAPVLPFIQTLPKDMADTPPVIEALQRYTEPKKWPKRSIVIYVGQSPLGIWGPWSLNEGGTGGSEEAVIRLGRELVKLGWKVTVFGMPGERAGTYDGVEWKQYYELNAKDEFDVLISWRAPHFFDHKFKARKRYLWLHDLMPAEEFTPDRIKNMDRVIFVSQYHADREEFRAIPKSKKFVSGNGIDPSDFEKYDGKFKRDPWRCIYMSANERGLNVLLNIWPDVLKEAPKATLDVYYGWHSFDAINRDNPERMAWKALMVNKMKELPGVTERGRIGQDDLNKEIFKSGIFAYPCTFPEVNCITAQKAMAGGAVPVTSDFAVMKDIIQYGEQVPMGKFDQPNIDSYKRRLIGWLKNRDKQEHVRKDMQTWAREKFDWKETAKGWNEDMQV